MAVSRRQFMAMATATVAIPAVINRSLSRRRLLQTLNILTVPDITEEKIITYPTIPNTKIKHYRADYIYYASFEAWIPKDIDRKHSAKVLTIFADCDKKIIFDVDNNPNNITFEEGELFTKVIFNKLPLNQFHNRVPDFEIELEIS